MYVMYVIWVKPSCKSIITTKEAHLRFTVVSFWGKLIFNGVLGTEDWNLFAFLLHYMPFIQVGSGHEDSGVNWLSFFHGQ